MKLKGVWKYILIVLFISIVLGILIHYEKFIYTLIPNSGSFRLSYKHQLSDIILDVVISSMVAFLTFIINYYIIKPFESSAKIGSKKVIIAVILTLVSITVLSDLLFNLKHLVLSNTYTRRFNLLFLSRDVLIATIVLLAVYFIKIVNDRQAVRLENEQLKNEKLISLYESLKNQVSPHFLFNSLTALRELIVQNPSKAQDYLNHLSYVLRYTLQSNQRKTQSLHQEMLVADSYLFLMKIRFGNKLSISKKIDEKYDSYFLPPLALQTLIENAIKHNEISKRHPLEIRIETTDNQTIKVRNAIQEKLSYEQSTGIGLFNLSRQFKFMAGKDITISKENAEFIVELPLLIDDKNESNNC
jgi:sensor histidine kinase YesM